MKQEVKSLWSGRVDTASLVTDIVQKDYRTAEVFAKYGIDFCCGGKRPLAMACDLMGVRASDVQEELEIAMRHIRIPNSLVYEEWDIDFLMDYLENLHHQYLKTELPTVRTMLDEFVKSHVKHFPYLADVQARFYQLAERLLSLTKQEEEVIFPYIRQLAHAHKDKEPYALLLIRTLRKPLEDVLYREQGTIADFLLNLRVLTNDYHMPANACVKHRVVLARLKELDADLTQHLYLEQNFLYPRIISIENELLNNA